jgi:tryptophan-rich sensory protein
LALIEIVVLWLAIGWTVRTFHRVRPLAAGLLLPYWAWTTYAAALNAAIWVLNR